MDHSIRERLEMKRLVKEIEMELLDAVVDRLIKYQDSKRPLDINTYAIKHTLALHQRLIDPNFGMKSIDNGSETVPANDECRTRTKRQRNK